MHLSPLWGPEDPSGFQSILYFCVYFCFSVWLSAPIFGDQSAARNCAQCMRPQAMGSNPLSGSIIYLSVLPPGCPRALCDFLISSVGVQLRDAFIIVEEILVPQKA